MVAVVAEGGQAAGLERVASAAGLTLHVEIGLRGALAWWHHPRLVLLAVELAADAIRTPSTRRPGLVLVAREPVPAVHWQSALRLGAEHLAVLPDEEPWLAERLREAAEPVAGRAAVVGVVGGCGGAGASVLAVGLALAAAARSLVTVLVDTDVLGGGLDLALGLETRPGLRWPDFAALRGHLQAGLLRSALPSVQGVPVLTWDRSGAAEPPPEVSLAVLDGARRGAELVVADLPRRLTPAAEEVARNCDLVVLVARPEVRGCAAALEVTRQWQTMVCDLRLVVREPSPAGLTARAVAEALPAAVGGAMALRTPGGPGSRSGGTRGRGPARFPRPHLSSAPRPGADGTERPRPGDRAVNHVLAGDRATNERWLVAQVRARVVRHGAQLDEGRLAAQVRAVATDAGLVLGVGDLLRVAARVRAGLWGLGPLEELLVDPEVTDVLVNGASGVHVDRGQGLEAVDVQLSEEEVRSLAGRLAGSAGRRLDEASPWVDARLPGGLRLHAVIPPVSPEGTHLSLRVLRDARFDLPGLVAAGSLPPAWAPVLVALVQARVAFLVSGGTGSGKTTLLATLLGSVPDAERIVLVEDVCELAPRHPHVVRLEARHANVEGRGAVDLGDLVRQALRMRPDRLVVGECRGAEVRDLLAALNTGHAGGAGTVHANTAAEVPTRLEALGSRAGLTAAETAVQVRAAFHAVVHLRRTTRGLRRVMELAVVAARGRTGVDVVPALVADPEDPRHPGSLGPGWPALSARLGILDGRPAAPEGSGSR